MRNPITPPQIRALAFPANPTPSIFPPTHYYLSTTLSSVLQHYINSDSPASGLRIHSNILKIGLQGNTSVAIKLLVLHLKCGSLRYARQVFEEMAQPTPIAYNYLLNGYVKHGKAEESFDLVRQMYSRNERPDGFTFSLILKLSGGRSGGAFSSLARQVHAQVVKCIVEDDVVLLASLIDSYVKCRRIGTARRVYEGMSVENVMCSTSLIAGYLNEGHVEIAEEIFVKTAQKDVVLFNAMVEGYSKSTETAAKSIRMYIEMQRLGFHRTISTFASVIGACSLLAALEAGRQVQAQIIKSRELFMADVKIGSALIDMYSKCGETDDALRVFDHMPEKNVFSWTSLMDGYGKNGKPKEAIEIFDRMQQREHRTEPPNEVTFLSALSACAHAGFVDRGWEIFKSMERDYAMSPGMEHYACMVDLLGRFGSINRAWEFVEAMPEKPNSDVWAALLSCCQLHGEVDKASIAADELLLRLHNDHNIERPGAFVALSNTLAEAGKWDRVSDVRELMKIRGMSKDTGFSSTI